MGSKEKQELIDAIRESNQISYQVYHDMFENSVKGFSLQLGQFEERNSEKLEEIKAKQDLTNGRVKKLENETAVIRWCARNPKLAAFGLLLLFVGAITLGIVLGIDNLISIVP
jgi:hypothetical protein